MSIIMGAIAGAGDAGQKYFEQEQKTDNEGDLAALRSDLEVNKAKLIAQNVSDSQDAQRTQEADSIDEAKTGIIDGIITKKYADAVPADPSTWTPDQQAAVDQSKQLDTDNLQSDSRVLALAGQQTGYIGAKDAAVLAQNEEGMGNKRDALLYKQLYENQKEEGRNNRSDAHIQLAQEKLAESARQSDNRLAVIAGKMGGGGKDNSTAESLKFLDSSRKEISSEAAELKSLFQVSLDGARGKDAIDAVNKTFGDKFAALGVRRNQINTDFGSLRAKLGLSPETASPGPAPAPAPAAKSARPPLSSFNK